MFVRCFHKPGVQGKPRSTSGLGLALRGAGEDFLAPSGLQQLVRSLALHARNRESKQAGSGWSNV